MLRWQPHTGNICPNACYDKEEYKLSMHLMLTRNYDMLSHVVFRLVAKVVEAKLDAAIVAPTRDVATGF